MTLIKKAWLATIICFAAFYFASPWLSLYSAYTGMKEGDSSKILGMLDLPSIKDGFKEDVRSALRGKKSPSDPLAAAGAEMMVSLAEKFVDQQVTTENISKVVKGEGKSLAEPKPGKKLSFSGEYDGTSKFDMSISLEATPSEPLYVIRMERFGFLGLSWKIKRIDISAILSILAENKK